MIIRPNGEVKLSLVDDHWVAEIIGRPGAPIVAGGWQAHSLEETLQTLNAYAREGTIFDTTPLFVYVNQRRISGFAYVADLWSRRNRLEILAQE